SSRRGQFLAFLEHGASRVRAPRAGAVEVGAVEQLTPTPVRLRGKLVEATHAVLPATQQLPQARLGDAPAMTSSPIAARASRKSTGGASGSPPVYGP
ncbi:hypothetical protein NJ76_10390, partial [Rhodococcus sp. IITR03]